MNIQISQINEKNTYVCAGSVVFPELDNKSLGPLLVNLSNACWETFEDTPLFGTDVKGETIWIHFLENKTMHLYGRLCFIEGIIFASGHKAVFHWDPYFFKAENGKT